MLVVFLIKFKVQWWSLMHELMRDVWSEIDNWEIPRESQLSHRFYQTISQCKFKKRHFILAVFILILLRSQVAVNYLLTCKQAWGVEHQRRSWVRNRYVSVVILYLVYCAILCCGLYHLVYDQVIFLKSAWRHSVYYQSSWKLSDLSDFPIKNCSVRQDVAEHFIVWSDKTC